MAPGISISSERNAPKCNAAVEHFVWDRHQNAHHQKIARSKSLITNSWAQREDVRLQASRRNVKRDQIQADRFADIERENMRLLLQMQSISRRKAPSSANKATAQLVLGKTNSSCGHTSLPPRGTGSNVGKRLNEMRRIDAENQKMLGRLQGAKPSVNLKEFNDAHEKQQRVMRMRCAHQDPGWRAEAMPRRSCSASPLPPVRDAPEDEFDQLECLQEELCQQAGFNEKQMKPTETPDMSQGNNASPNGVMILKDQNTGTPNSRPTTSDLDDGSIAMGPQSAIQADLAPKSFGGRIPEASRALVEAIMAERDKEAEQGARLADRLRAAEEAERAAADDVDFARDNAAEALRQAQAIDDSNLIGNGNSECDDVIHRFEDMCRRRARV